MTNGIHTAYCAHDPDGKPLWYTIRPTKEQAITVYTNANRFRKWSRCEDVGYTVRKMEIKEIQ